MRHSIYVTGALLAGLLAVADSQRLLSSQNRRNLDAPDLRRLVHHGQNQKKARQQPHQQLRNNNKPRRLKEAKTTKASKTEGAAKKWASTEEAVVRYEQTPLELTTRAEAHGDDDWNAYFGFNDDGDDFEEEAYEEQAEEDDGGYFGDADDDDDHVEVAVEEAELEEEFEEEQEEVREPLAATGDDWSPGFFDYSEPAEEEEQVTTDDWRHDYFDYSQTTSHQVEEESPVTDDWRDDYFVYEPEVATTTSHQDESSAHSDDWNDQYFDYGDNQDVGNGGGSTSAHSDDWNDQYFNYGDSQNDGGSTYSDDWNDQYFNYGDGGSSANSGGPAYSDDWNDGYFNYEDTQTTGGSVYTDDWNDDYFNYGDNGGSSGNGGSGGNGGGSGGNGGGDTFNPNNSNELVPMSIEGFQEAAAIQTILSNPSMPDEFAPGSTYLFSNETVYLASELTASPLTGSILDDELIAVVDGKCTRTDAFDPNAPEYTGRAYCLFTYEFVDPVLGSAGKLNAEGILQLGDSSRLAITGGSAFFRKTVGEIWLHPVISLGDAGARTFAGSPSRDLPSEYYMFANLYMDPTTVAALS